MRELPVPRTRTPESLLFCQLPQMMLGVGTVELAPLFGAKRSKDRMIEQFDAPAKPPLGIGEGGIHSHQGIIESPQ